MTGSGSFDSAKAGGKASRGRYVGYILDDPSPRIGAIPSCRSLTRMRSIFRCRQPVGDGEYEAIMSDCAIHT